MTDHASLFNMLTILNFSGLETITEYLQGAAFCCLERKAKGRTAAVLV